MDDIMTLAEFLFQAESYVLGRDWNSIGHTLLGAGVFSFLLSKWNEHRTRAKRAKYLAMRLTVILEAFAYSCLRFNEDNQFAESSQRGQYPDWTTRLPTMPAYPDYPDGWVALEPELARGALEIVNKISNHQDTISFYSNNLPDELYGEMPKIAALLGLEANGIVIQLRKMYSLGDSNLETNINERLNEDLIKANALLERAKQGRTGVA